MVIHYNNKEGSYLITIIINKKTIEAELEDGGFVFIASPDEGINVCIDIDNLSKEKKGELRTWGTELIDLIGAFPTLESS
jgi:hypothetical protein